MIIREKIIVGFIVVHQRRESFVFGAIFPSTLTITWRRFAYGLFQPLGVKVVGGKIFVICRDQLVALHDLNLVSIGILNEEKFGQQPPVAIEFNYFSWVESRAFKSSMFAIKVIYNNCDMAVSISQVVGFFTPFVDG